MTIAPEIRFHVVTNDPAVLLKLVLGDSGIALVPLYMGKWPETGNKLIQVLPRWSTQPIALCALFSGQSRLTPKVQVLLDFLAEYIGTDRDPRLRGVGPKGMFTDTRMDSRAV
jgi:DNA-binding transcriptional LysR family regulator